MAKCYHAIHHETFNKITKSQTEINHAKIAGKNAKVYYLIPVPPFLVFDLVLQKRPKGSWLAMRKALPVHRASPVVVFLY